MNKTEKAEREYFSKVYDILIYMGGATPHRKEHFIDLHLSKNEYPCDEYRFQGYFGFGGKYRRERNSVDYYVENSTPKLDLLEKEINAKLKEIVKWTLTLKKKRKY